MENFNNGTKGGNFCMSKAALAIGDGSKLGVAIASTVGTGMDYCIDGILYNKADAATDLPLSADDAQGLLTKCLYLICIDSAGAVTSVQGTPVLTADLTAGNEVLKWPELPADKAPIGAVKIQTTGTQNFTPGTTALDAGSGANDITATYYDLFSVPVEPLTS
jgi:hypothetical protein